MLAHTLRRASVGGAVFLLGISSPLTLHPIWALCLVALVALGWTWMPRLRPLFTLLGLVACFFLADGLIESVPSLVGVALVWVIGASIRKGEGSFGSWGITLVVVALGAASLQVAQARDDRALATRAWVQGGELLAARGGGSLALALGPADLGDARLELVLPLGIEFFSDPDESVALGVAGALDAPGLAAYLQRQIRAAAPKPSDPLLWLGAARRAEALSLAQVQALKLDRSGETIEVLRFTAGRTGPSASWRFVCPGAVLGKGPRRPPRTMSAVATQPLCPSKYASPLVAAMGAHSAIPGVREGEGTLPWGWPAIVDRMAGPRVAARILSMCSLLFLGLWLFRGARGPAPSPSGTFAVSSLGLVSSILVIGLSLAAAKHGWSPNAGGGDWMLGPGEWLWRAGWAARSSALEAALAALALWITLGATQCLMLIWESERRGTRAQGDE